MWVDGKLVSTVYVSEGLTGTAKYLYNDFDEPVGMIVTGAERTVSTYYYLKNAQGDITNIVSSSGVITQGTVLCVDKNKQNLLKYCRGESNAKASKNNE